MQAFLSFLSGPFPASIFFIYNFSIELTVTVQYNFLPMTGFKLQTSGIRSNHSPNWVELSLSSSSWQKNRGQKSMFESLQFSESNSVITKNRSNVSRDFLWKATLEICQTWKYLLARYLLNILSVRAFKNILFSKFNRPENIY